MTVAEGRRGQIWELLVSNGVIELMNSITNPAVILERFPRAAGATAWFTCRSEDELKSVVHEFHPGSAVTFYFDNRLSLTTNGSQVRPLIAAVIDQCGDAVVGEYSPGDVHLDMQVVSDDRELGDFFETLGDATQLYFGAFPGSDNDGSKAVTIVLPDADGIVRMHPH